MEQSSPQTDKRPEKPLRRSIKIAAGLYLYDVFVAGQGTIGLFTFPVLIFWVLPRAFFDYARGRKEQGRRRILRAGIYPLMAVAILGSVRIQNHMARKRAEALIVTCRSYQTKYGHLPESLQALVPEFLPNVPRPKFTLLFNNFMYFRSGDGGSLVYAEFPPFGRRVYNFKTNSWGQVD